MRKTDRKKNLEWLVAVGGRVWTVGLVVIGLTPAAAAQAGPERAPVCERIDRIRTVLDERGLDALGSVATVIPAGVQDPDWDDWNDWDDWADF